MLERVLREDFLVLLDQVNKSEDRGKLVSGLPLAFHQ